MRYRALLTALLLCGTTGGATAPSDSAQCERSYGIPDSQPLPMRDGPAQP